MKPGLITTILTLATVSFAGIGASGVFNGGDNGESSEEISLKINEEMEELKPEKISTNFLTPKNINSENNEDRKLSEIEDQRQEESRKIEEEAKKRCQASGKFWNQWGKYGTCLNHQQTPSSIDFPPPFSEEP